MHLSIIIVSWNVRDLLVGCLNSIFAFPPACDYEVIVVDNASTDGSSQVVKQRFPQVHLLENQGNVGFAAANNQGIRQSSSQFVLLLNPDTELKSGALEILLAFMRDHPGVGAAGSRYLNPDGTLQTSCYPRPTIARELWRLFHLDRLHPFALYPLDSWDTEAPRPVDVLQGASLLLRRQALHQVGLLDEGFFIYSEEVDLCYRFQKAGWELFWVPRSVIIHYGGQSTQQVSREMFLHLYRGKLRYFRKHHGAVPALVYKFILAVAGLVRLCISPLACLEPPAKRQQHFTVAGNYWRMLLALPGM